MVFIESVQYAEGFRENLHNSSFVTRYSVAVHFLVIALVITAGDVVEPLLVVEVPAHGLFDPFLEL